MLLNDLFPAFKNGHQALCRSHIIPLPVAQNMIGVSRYCRPVDIVRLVFIFQGLLMMYEYRSATVIYFFIEPLLNGQATVGMQVHKLMSIDRKGLNKFI